MKAHLMYRDRDVDLERDLPPCAQDVTQDLELDRPLAAMARGDDFLLTVARRAVLFSLTDPEAIVYRQQILRDCLEQGAVTREMYDLAVAAITEERGVHASFIRSPDAILHRSARVLEMFMEKLRALRRIADEHASEFRSEGFTTLFDMLAGELDDDYFETVEAHLRQLRFRQGALISAQLGKGNTGAGYVLRKPRQQSWTERLNFLDRSGYSFQIADRDESGAKALRELRERGIDLVADALGQSTDHILSFFRMLRTELGFYVACLNLDEQLARKGEPTCLPEPLASGTPSLRCRGLYDVSLSLGVSDRVVGNDVNADGKSLVMITGANQGGKSTFARSVGLAQLMMQAGMFVAAESLRADVRSGVFTHFKREEDATMRSGKLDEELGRMSQVVDTTEPNALLLCNESFAATNEREGSEIARQILRALLETGTKVVFVTHMYDLAHGAYARHSDAALFLRAEREADGGRTFRLVEGEPLPTSYGEDLYRRIFGTEPSGRPEAASSSAHEVAT